MYKPNEYSEDVSEYVLTVDTGDGIYVPPANREITVKLSMKQLTISDVHVKVEARNVPSGLKARFTNDVVTLTVAAPEDVDAAGKIKAYVDLSNKKAGKYELQIVVDTEKDIKVLETAHIGVVLS